MALFFLERKLLAGHEHISSNSNTFYSCPHSTVDPNSRGLGANDASDIHRHKQQILITSRSVMNIVNVGDSTTQIDRVKLLFISKD